MWKGFADWGISSNGCPATFFKVLYRLKKNGGIKNKKVYIAALTLIVSAIVDLVAFIPDIQSADTHHDHIAP